MSQLRCLATTHTARTYIAAYIQPLSPCFEALPLSNVASRKFDTLVARNKTAGDDAWLATSCVFMHG